MRVDRSLREPWSGSVRISKFTSLISDLRVSVAYLMATRLSSRLSSAAMVVLRLLMGPTGWSDFLRNCYNMRMWILEGQYIPEVDVTALLADLSYCTHISCQLENMNYESPLYHELRWMIIALTCRLESELLLPIVNLRIWIMKDRYRDGCFSWSYTSGEMYDWFLKPINSSNELILVQVCLM